MKVSTWLHVAIVALAGAALLSCHDSDDYLTAGDVSQVLGLESQTGVTTMPADGFSRLALVARITTDATNENRTIVFSRTGGTLLGGTAAGETREVIADGDGAARIELQSDLEVRSVVVTARLKNHPEFARSLTIEIVEALADDVVRFIAAPQTAPADGATRSSFRVEIAAGLPANMRTVSYSTTNGSFAPGNVATLSVVADASNVAAIDLISPGALGSAQVRASIAGFVRDTTIAFDRALPDVILVNATAFQVAATGSSSVTITGKFERDIGTVTSGTPATFDARDDMGATIGLFTGATTVSGANQQASATFRPGATAYRGLVDITVGAVGSSVTGMTQVEIVSP